MFRCNARPKENPAHFSLDVNLTLPAPERQPTGFEVLESSTTGKSEVLAELTQEQLLALIKKIQDLHAKHVPEIRTLILDHSALDERKYVVMDRDWANKRSIATGTTFAGTLALTTMIPLLFAMTTIERSSRTSSTRTNRPHFSET